MRQKCWVSDSEKNIALSNDAGVSKKARWGEPSSLLGVVGRSLPKEPKACLEGTFIPGLNEGRPYNPQQLGELKRETSKKGIFDGGFSERSEKKTLIVDADTIRFPRPMRKKCNSEEEKAGTKLLKP